MSVKNITYNLLYPSIFAVLLSRAGFILIQSGSIPTENSYNLILQNIVEFSITTGSYGLFGVLLSFGSQSYYGFIGYGPWDYTQMDSERIIFGRWPIYMFVVIVSFLLLFEYMYYVFDQEQQSVIGYLKNSIEDVKKDI